MEAETWNEILGRPSGVPRYHVVYPPARPPAGNLANVLNAIANCVNDDLLATHIQGRFPEFLET